MSAVVTAFAVVFVAELGDKTQLVAMSLGTRFTLRQMVVGLAIAYALSSGLAAVIGGLLGAALPDRALSIGGGVAFLAFAAVELWRTRGEAADDENSMVGAGWRRGILASPIVLIATTVSVAELGDKTQLATATRAANADPLLTWIGATIGLLAAGILGAVVGRLLGDRLPRRTLRYASAALFAVVGIVMIATAI